MNELRQKILEAQANLDFLKFQETIAQYEPQDGLDEHERFIKYIILNEVCKILAGCNVVNVPGEQIMKYVNNMYDHVFAAESVGY